MIRRNVLALCIGMAWMSAGYTASYFACDCGAGATAGCIPGNDAAAGDAPIRAWRSYDRAQDAWPSLAAGDTLSLCRGGVFPISGANSWVNRNCRSDQPCTLGAYDAPWSSGSEPAPRIVQSAGDALSLSNSGVLAQHEEGYVIRDLELVCTSCGNSGSGVFLYNDIDDVVLERLLIRGFEVGVLQAGSFPCGADPDCDGRNTRLTLRNSVIRDNTRQGYLGAGNDSIIADNRFIGNGGVQGILDHNVYVSGNAQNMQVLRNELQGASASTTGQCQASSMVAHGILDDLRIEGNLIHENLGEAGQGCWGIALIPGFDTSERFLRAVVRGNTVRNVGNAAIAIASCVDCLVENNVIVHEQAYGVAGVSAPAVIRQDQDAALERLTVRNNSIYTTSFGREGIRVGGEGTGHIIVSNAIQIATSNGDWACLDLNLPASAYAVVDHNVCDFAGGAGHEWERGSGSLLAWRAVSGFDSNSLGADPGFIAPAGPIYNLSARSAAATMVGRGHPTQSAATDFYGITRGGAPDTGAHQWRSGFADGFEDGPPIVLRAYHKHSD